MKLDILTMINSHYRPATDKLFNWTQSGTPEANFDSPLEPRLLKEKSYGEIKTVE